MAIAEASWTQHGKIDAYAPVLHGERGLLRADLKDPAGVEVPDT